MSQETSDLIINALMDTIKREFHRPLEDKIYIHEESDTDKFTLGFGGFFDEFNQVGINIFNFHKRGKRGKGVHGISIIDSIILRFLKNSHYDPFLRKV